MFARIVCTSVDFVELSVIHVTLIFNCGYLYCVRFIRLFTMKGLLLSFRRS